MRLNRFFVLVGALGILSLLISGCIQKEKWVARIGEKYTITLNELNNFARRQSDQPSSKLTGATMKQYLDKMVENKILIASAYQMKLDQDSSIMVGMKFKKQTLMLQELYTRLNVDPFIKEADIRDYYSRMGKDVVIRTIFFYLSSQAGPEDEKKAMAKAEEMLKKLKKSKSSEEFSELARRFSEDKTTASNGGLVGQLSWTRTDDPIRKAAFSMKESEHSGIIRNNQGLNIIYVEEIQKKERKPLEQVRVEIRNQLSGERRDQILERQREYEKKITEQTKIRWIDQELDTLAAKLKSKAIYGRDAFLFFLDQLPNNEKEKTLLQYKKSKFTILDFQKKSEERMSPYFNANFGSTDELKQLIERWLITDMLLDMAETKRLDRSQFVVKNIQEIMEKEMVNLLIKQELWNSVNPTPTTVKPFDQIRETVSQDDVETRREDNLSTFISKKKEEFGVQINTKALEQLFNE